MKKLVTILAALFVAVSMVAMFAACGEKTEETPVTDTNTTTETTTETKTEVTDTTKAPETKETPKTEEKPAEQPSGEVFMGVAVFETNYGNFEISLYKDTPVASQNMFDKVKAGFYNGLTFHRVVQGFVIQGGDPTGTGAGGGAMGMDPRSPINQNLAKTVSMASSNAGVNQSDCQFFVNLADKNTQLDGMGFVVFGLVTSGYDVVEKIGNVPCTTNPSGENSQPVEKVVITKAYIK